ncbi:MAG: Mini-ribonuclease 3 [Eubacteriales bacterium]
MTFQRDDFFTRKISYNELTAFHPIKLAYLGDAIYELYIRKYILSHYNMRIKDINQKCICYVKATMQAKVITHLMPILTEEELRIVKKGRNATSNTTPKNTGIIEYKTATGFEALLGYLYLNQNIDRLEELIAKSIQYVELMDN